GTARGLRRAGPSPRTRVGPTALEALAAATVALAADPLHGQRVVVVGLGHVHEVPEDLVVAGRGDPEPGADGRLLPSRPTPPVPVEVEERATARREAHQARDPGPPNRSGSGFPVVYRPVCPNVQVMTLRMTSPASMARNASFTSSRWMWRETIDPMSRRPVS